MQNVVLFDFDSTLARTKSVREIRESGRYRELTAEKLKAVRLYYPVAALIEELKAHDVLLGIVTNAGRGYIDPLLVHLDLTDAFDVVITYSDVKQAKKQAKPYGDGILMALAALGVEPGPHVLYVGDEYTDIAAAYNAGVTPIVPTWASREPVSTAPAAILSSKELVQYFEDPEDFQFFAELSAQYDSALFDRRAVHIMPLDLSGNIVTLKDQLRIICLGRYFSQQTVVTALLHEAHALSRDIVAKEDDPKFELQDYWDDVLLHVLRTAPALVFLGKHPFDLVTVVPSKSGGHPRLENFLERVEDRAQEEFPGIVFDGSLLRYVDDARKQKTLPKSERAAEAVRALQLRGSAARRIAGKNVLVIDDVVTTSSTMGRAIRLLEGAGAASVFGLAFAKTVNVLHDDKICPKCGRTMRIRRNPKDNTHFWGCTGYGSDEDPCKYTENAEGKMCPKCARPMVRRTNSQKQTSFWGCSGFRETPPCKHTENIL